ncbi:MAG TPA: FcoT family thioesterase [Candidatus Nanoarchaeia archaeon]|nr:FcoT family thioesterase [Candidatus Nanoarchaeia archaeon]
MRVSQDIVDRVLELYVPGYRYLQEVDMASPASSEARGRFIIGETEYREKLNHLTDAEAQMCLNQMCYAFFWQGITQNRWKGLEGLAFADYLDIRKERMYVRESYKKFYRKIEPGFSFYGYISLKKVRKQRDSYVAIVGFDFDEGATKGHLELVLTR